MTYIRQNVVKPLGKSPGAAAPKEPNLVVVAVDDILQWPTRDSKGVRMLGNFVMKPNARMIEWYSTPSKIKASYENSGEEDSIVIKQKIESESPGDELALAEAIQNWLGVNAIVIYGSCADSFRKVIGTKCAPVQLKPSHQNDNDARKHMLVFEQFANSAWLPGHYEGALVFSDPFAVADSTAIAVSEANGNLYQLPSLAVTEAIAIASNDLAHGQIITLIGGGGSDPAVLSTGVADKSALLVDGADWVGLEGASINLQVFKSGAITLFIELSRA